MTATCAREGCDRPAVLAVKTADAGLRGITSTVYYEPDSAPRGAEPNCEEHGVALLASLVRVMTP